MNWNSSDNQWMTRAIELALRGQGQVEPNPMVGCVLVKDNQVVGEGWHEIFGCAHAEINALRNAGQSARGSTAYVSLEPCAHFGKTPPCADALIEAGVSRVVVAHPDPNPLVAGSGIGRLQAAGIATEIGLLPSEAAQVLAPYLKRTNQGLPWIIAKWAMTWDGKIATASGDSKWISNERSRELVHQIRGRVDGIMTGISTVLRDDPLLTARPTGKRLAKRIILDTSARTPLDSRLCQTAKEFPTLIAVGDSADPARLLELERGGCEIWQAGQTPGAAERLTLLLHELANRGMTNILVEGGSAVLGTLADLRQIDEVHVFIGGTLLGGRDALTPVGGLGAPLLRDGQSIHIQSVQQLENDLYLIGRVER